MATETAPPSATAAAVAPSEVKKGEALRLTEETAEQKERNDVMLQRLRIADGERKKAADDATSASAANAVNDRDSIRNFLSQFDAAKLGN